MKTDKSNSWFIAIKKIFVTYGLNDPYELLVNPPTKFGWKRLVNQHVDQYWVDKIRFESTLYPSLLYLSTAPYACGKRHPLVQELRNQQEIPRVRLKLKVVTGTYILQVNRSSFNQNRIDPTCLLCGEGEETMQHFILDCVALFPTRVPILQEIKDICNELYPVSDANTLMQIILDCYSLLNYIKNPEHVILLEWTASSEFGTYHLCEQQRFRRACASAQSRQNLRCSLIQAVSQEEPSDRKPDPWSL